jgi:endogenous inhibitor of DNA gyrase (YacG/DUF329 family)
MSPKPAPCPICGQPSAPNSRPFCGSACRDRDLLQWLGEGYRMPGRPAATDENEGEFGLDSTRD